MSRQEPSVIEFLMVMLEAQKCFISYFQV